MGVETRKKVLVGTVVSTKMEKTITVKVERYNTHPKYNKRILRSKRFLVHDSKSEANLNDHVEIVECRPLSKNKKFRLNKVIKKGIGEDYDTDAN